MVGSGRRNVRRLARSVAALIAIVTLVGCDSSGPVDPDVPRSQPVREAAAATTPGVEEDLRLALGGRESLLDTRLDECTAGQNNWKVKHSFQWTCSLALGSLVVGGDDFEAGIHELEDSVVASGCTPYFNEVHQEVEDADYLIEHYWRPRAADRTAKDMPYLLYECGDHEVTLTTTDATETNPLWLPRCYPDRPTSEQQIECQTSTPEEAARALGQHQGELMAHVLVTTNYHHEPW